jgi:hypothetical protein
MRPQDHPRLDPQDSRIHLRGRAVGPLAAMVAYFGGLAVLDGTHGPLWIAPLLVVAAASLVGLAFLPRTPLARIRWSRRYEWSVFVALITLAAWFALPSLISPAVRSDQGPSIQCAARSLLKATDPWRESEVRCISSLSLHTADLTPLRTGPFAHQAYPSKTQILHAERTDLAANSPAGFPLYGYPPLAAVWALPVAHASLRVTDWYIIGLLLLLLGVAWRRHLPMGLIPLAIQVLALSIFLSGFNGDPEILGYAALISAYLWLDRPRASAIWFSIAVLTNPLCWVALPGWVTIVLRQPDRSLRLAWLAATATALFLPWLAWDHNLLLELWRFVTLPEFPLGFSVAALIGYPYPPAQLFFVSFATVILAFVTMGWRCRSLRWLAAAVVWIAFAVSWRGNGYYFLPLFWLSPAILVGWEALSKPRVLGPGSGPEVLAPANALGQ